MTTSFYFDTNVFDHIYKRINISDAEFSKLKSSIDAGKINILASILNLEETVSILSCDENLSLFKGEISLILDLCNWRQPLKPADLLLADDVQSFAKFGYPAGPFLKTDSPDYCNFNRKFQELIKLSPESKTELLSIVQRVREQKEAFLKGMKEAQKSARDKSVSPVKKSEDSSPDFRGFWCRSLASSGLVWASVENMAKRCGVLEECKTRGLENLFDIRSVRLYVGSSLSYIYGQLFESRSPRIGDSRDFQHAVLASASDVFVTQDEDLLTMVGRIPIDDFEVISLQSFLGKYIF